VTIRPTRATVGGRVYLDLRKAASAAGRPTDEFLHLYALEGFLDRLSSSPHAEHFVLKGGLLLAAYGARRPTRDIDFAALDVANDLDHVRRMINEITAIGREDGLEFDLDATRLEAIRDEEDYGGARVTIHGGLSTGVIQFHVDVNIGEPLWPPPDEVDLPRVLGGPPIRVRGYRVELILAEKIVTALHRGTANTRWRDFVDIAAWPATTSTTLRWWNRFGGSPRTGKRRSIRCAMSSPAIHALHRAAGRRGAESNDSRTRRPSTSPTCSTRFSGSPIRFSSEQRRRPDETPWPATPAPNFGPWRNWGRASTSCSSRKACGRSSTISPNGCPSTNVRSAAAMRRIGSPGM
jgi:hypothetical protein